MANITDMSSLAVRTSAITGSFQDGASAAGYGAWVNAVTGSYPDVINKGNGKAIVVLSPKQAAKMNTWIDRRIRSSIIPTPQKSNSLSIQFSPAIMPTALKYGLIAGSIFFAGGYILGKL